METHPQLLFVAGPNGAGKSTFSKVLSEPDAVIFDVDKIIPLIEAQSPGIAKKQVYDLATQEFFKQATAAVSHKRHFTLETNFRDEDLMAVVAEFKRHGYTTNLVYLTLESIGHSVFRVNQRVKNGGHFVDHKNIQQNYDIGLQYLERFAERFDNLDIVNAGDSGPQLRSLLRIRDGQQIYVSKNVPEKLKELINSINLKFASAQKTSRKNRKGPRL